MKIKTQLRRLSDLPALVAPTGIEPMPDVSDFAKKVYRKNPVDVIKIQ
ncbi:MAG TPA: hypothetical protein VK517_10775 [Cyclobacteriaceae bacterium]|nr:hypothetical protein [Cyclobacteriaceae bacterium]